MKKALPFVGLGLTICVGAILYSIVFSDTGSLRLFIASYLGGLLTASVAAGLGVFFALRKKSKLVSVLSGLGTFAGVALLIISPFYVLH